ncbi:hypothetical protein N7520_007694 [Penicillium odoratum]|uniref:uncharacterized protein n=1 Tax=Penicillium odoratum TaxID=1167516 RepID=UPI0025466596|nr:uncharacterized protein N7520_007694 [Penicillium odoratum]KAJ5760538.1 hypothetical protein N7520_007694 [Penicillium odoratum]
MSCSCYQPATPPLPNESPSDESTQIDVGNQICLNVNDEVSTVRCNPGAVEASSLDVTVDDGYDKDGATRDGSCQDDCCGSVSANTRSEEAQNENNHILPSLQCPATACRDNNRSGSSQQKTGPGSCCDDQPSETFCNTDVSPPGDLAWEDSEEGLAIEASEGTANTYLRAHFPKCCSSTLSSSNSAPAELKEPECCSGVPTPCCDETCLDRLALRKCHTGMDIQRVEATQQAETLKSVPNKGDAPQRRACDHHRRAVREQYAATLATLGCICRALIALSKETCCLPRGMPSPLRKRSSREPLKGPKATQTSGSENGFVESCSGESHCKPKSSCSGDKVSALCNSESPLRASTKSPKLVQVACTGVESKNSETMASDLKRQNTGAEHVILSVSGMTCTGCETKLNRTLAIVSGVRNVKTSLILSRAEFDLDLNMSSVKYVMKHLQRTTEFQFDVITSSGSSMDIITSEDLSTFVNRPWPEGVTDVSAVNKDEIRVSFDPELVGARDLIEKHWAGVARLAPTRDDPALGAGKKHVRHVGYITLFSVILTIPVLVLTWAPIPEREIPYNSTLLALATLVQVMVAGPFYPKALKALILSKVIEMDLLVVLSTTAAYVFSLISFGYLVAGNPLSTGHFFETSTLLVSLIMVGRYVAALARQKAVESISIRSLQSQNAVLVDGFNSFEGRDIDVRLLQYGDIFMVAPDTRIPTDGTIVSGSSEVNESMLTGESHPVEKGPQSRVMAGTISGSGTLHVRVTRLPGDNTITAIAAMVDEAKLSKPKMQELADKVASHFVPVIVALAIATFVVWIAVGVAVQGKTGSEAAVQSITYAITVLFVSCPCAIGLAVPMVVVFASGIAAEQGVIFKSADAIEVAYKASHVVFDKTGTLTKGNLSVVVEHCLENGETQLLFLLGLISNNKHPISVAVVDHLRRNEVITTAFPGVKSLTGRGMEGEVAGQTMRGGNSRWLNVQNHPLVQQVLLQGYTAFCFTIDGVLCAVSGLEDSLRDDACQVVTTLLRRNVSVHVVSGDDAEPIQKVVSILGIPDRNVQAHSSLSDKQSYIKNLLGDSVNVKEPVVIFCGDGTNDAVALAQATVGVHMSTGSDIAQAAADVVLMRPALSGVITVMDTSKVSVRRIKFNFGWSFIYNTFAVLLAAGAFVKARIPPEYAGLGELISVLPVIIAAALLRWTKI